MKRRAILRHLTGTCLAAGMFALGGPFGLRMRPAQAANGKTLVVVFQRGACDGLNSVVPYEDDDYYRLRPSIAVRSPNALDPQAALDLDSFFGLHPALTALQSIYRAGDLAILPTVQYDDATRSHFDGQLFIESGAPTIGLDGWLNRHLVTKPKQAPLRAISLGAGVPDALRDEARVSTFNDLADLRLDNDSDEEQLLKASLETIYAQTAASGYRNEVMRAGRIMLDELGLIDPGAMDSYQPANGAAYTDSSFGRQLMQVAYLIKLGVGLEIAALNIGGWDTHIRQGGGEADGIQARRLKEFSDGIAAFYTDLGAQMNDVVLLTMTEFGRTAAENASGGTDHGNAAVWYVIGKSVQGGIHMGAAGWPGLAEAQLLNGRYLAHTLDYRDVLAEVLNKHLNNNNLAALLPGHVYKPIGFL